MLRIMYIISARELKIAAIFICFLIADENIIGLFIAGNRNNSFSDFFNLLSFLSVDLASNAIGIFQRLLKITVIHNAVKAGTMAGGDFLASGRIIYILDAVFTQHQIPVQLSCTGFDGQKLIKYILSLIVLTVIQVIVTSVI